VRQSNVGRSGSVGLLSALAVAASGCAGTATHASASRTCLPSRLSAQPQKVQAGGTLVLSSGAFQCARRYLPGHSYTLVLAPVGRAAPLRLAAVRVHQDGSFTASIVVPATASPGESYVIVHGSPFDAQCDDTGSCADYEARVQVVPAH
jgi:hypothetical protein